MEAITHNHFFNILLSHKTISWANRFWWPIFFLKLNFLKPYDKMNWEFLFENMRCLGIPREFGNMKNILFLNVKVNIVINGKLSMGFAID